MSNLIENLIINTNDKTLFILEKNNTLLDEKV